MYNTPQANGVNLALFADDTCLYGTECKEGCVSRKLQQELDSMAARCKRWNREINEEQTRGIYFSHQIRPSETILTLN
jgi:hypothetical protein